MLDTSQMVVGVVLTSRQDTIEKEIGLSGENHENNNDLTQSSTMLRRRFEAGLSIRR